MPKGTDLSDASQTWLNDVAAQMNNRPRKTLGWRTPPKLWPKKSWPSDQPLRLKMESKVLRYTEYDLHWRGKVMIFRCLMVLLIVGSALPVQARDVIVSSTLGIVNVVDIENCDMPHMRTYASSDVYARQMATDPRGYVQPYLEAVREYDWYCQRPALDYVLPIDYYVMGVKIAEFRLKVVQDQPPWIIESARFLDGVETPKNDAIDFISRTILSVQDHNAQNGFSSRFIPVEPGSKPSISVDELESFTQLDSRFIGRADVLELLAFLKYDPAQQSPGFCTFDQATMERAAEGGSVSAMLRVVGCLNEGTSIDAMQQGHPGLSELSDEDYNKFRYYLAKAIYSGYLPATLYVSHPIPRFADDVPLDRGTISEVLEVVEQFSENPIMTFSDFHQDNDGFRSVTSNAARVALNDWVLSNECNWRSVVDLASQQGNNWGAVGALLGSTRPTANGWCMADLGGASVYIRVGSVDRLNCATVGAEDHCQFAFWNACYATTQFGDIGGRSASENIYCTPLTMFPNPGFARFTRDETGKLRVLSFDK